MQVANSSRNPSIRVTYAVASLSKRSTYQVPLFLEERVREQVLERQTRADPRRLLGRADVSGTRSIVEERREADEGVGRALEVALLALLLVLLLEPVHLQPKAHVGSAGVFLRCAVNRLRQAANLDNGEPLAARAREAAFCCLALRHDGSYTENNHVDVAHAVHYQRGLAHGRISLSARNISGCRRFLAGGKTTYK